jgi:8-oxo-dGTP pyrophosphatase MutT (NUDIX family)
MPVRGKGGVRLIPDHLCVCCQIKAGKDDVLPQEWERKLPRVSRETVVVLFFSQEKEYITSSVRCQSLADLFSPWYDEQNYRRRFMNDYIASVRKLIGHTMLLLVGAGVFIHQDGKLLLQRRRDDDNWADHGGCAEIGETVEETARREVLEETGLTAGKLTLIGVFSGPDRVHTYPNGDQTYVIGVYYLCEDFTGTLRPQAEEVTDLQWFDLDHLPDSIMPLCQRPLDTCVAVLKSR